MNKPFSSIHARTFCHATEDLDRVKTALENVVGKLEVNETRTEGHFGNPITVLESSSEQMGAIDELFSKLSGEDINELIGSIDSRVDDGCNLFIRVDKQSAYRGDIKLGRNDDVISVRIKVRSFPAKHEIAVDLTRTYLEDLLQKRS